MTKLKTFEKKRFISGCLPSLLSRAINVFSKICISLRSTLIERNIERNIEQFNFKKVNCSKLGFARKSQPRGAIRQALLAVNGL
ncbi:MAG: hypothetical protein LBH03_03290 [Holophagales bacterium]|jgi:hypothetical protein|nr:hypothetical protein [Holophagales bacterium]